MADQLQLRGGTTTEHSTFTGALREVTVDTTKKTLVVHDNATAGGTPLAKENLSNVPAGTITSTMIADGTIATADIADGAVTSGKIADGTIVNADINAAAAIDLTKLANGALPTGITVSSANITDLTLATADIADGAVTSAKIADGTLVNADINASAAIAGTKISPDFGSQNTTTTGTSTAASFIPTSSTVPTNGVYLPSANNVAISTNGTGRLFVDATGNVGVKTGSPSVPLEIARLGGAWAGISPIAGTALFVNSGSASTTAAARISILSGNAASAAIYFGDTDNNSEGIIQLDNTNDSLQFSVNGSERLRITSAGLVGLGTSSPSGPIHVTASSDGFISHTFSNTSNGSSAVNRIQIGNDVSDGTGQIVVYGSQHSTLPNVLDVNNATNAAMRLLTNNTERVRITAGGLVGIGTTSPNFPFAVKGTNDAYAQFLNNDTGTSSGDGSLIGVDSDENLVLRNRENTNILFFTVDTEKARIDNSGRLLVGTSSSSYAALLQVSGNTTSSTGHGILQLKKGGDALYAGNDLGAIWFGDNIGGNRATIEAMADGTGGVGDLPARLVFSTTADGASSPTERARITSKGYFKASYNGSYYAVGNSYHEFLSGVNDELALHIESAATSNPYGVRIRFSAASPNDATRYFLTCVDSGTTTRAEIRSNGGLANYSANNVNLSDINAKKDIAPAAGTWDCLKEWEIVNFRYKDQPEDADLNMGVIAQQVAESCPEVITVFQEAKEATETEPAQEERLGVKDQQMMWMAIKALQEAQLRIETLEAEVAALKGA